METTTRYMGYIGIMEKNMEITIIYWGYVCWDNGKEHGNYYDILGLYRDDGKEHGSYNNIFE